MLRTWLCMRNMKVGAPVHTTTMFQTSCAGANANTMHSQCGVRQTATESIDAVCTRRPHGVPMLRRLRRLLQWCLPRWVDHCVLLVIALLRLQRQPDMHVRVAMQCCNNARTRYAPMCVRSATRIMTKNVFHAF